MKNQSFVLYLILMIVVSMLNLASCDGGKKTGDTGKSTQKTEATGAAKTESSAAAPAKSANAITIVGSDTTVNLVDTLAKAYMKKNPTDSISVSGGGSGSGISSLINETCDIANSSRAIQDKEMERAKKKNLDVKEHIIALDAVAIIVNAENPIKELTMEQVQKMFKGEITNWKDFGLKDANIVLHGRQPTSGTFGFVREHVVQGEFAPSFTQQSGNAAIVTNVEADVNACGYVGAGYLKSAGPKIKAVPIKKDAASPAYLPTEAERVYSGEYSIARNLYQYTIGDPQGIAKKLIDFIKSDEGQAIVEESGFYKIKK